MFFKKESASVSSAIDSFFSIPHNCIQGGPLLTGGIIVNVGGQSGHRFAVKQEVVHPVLSRNILQQKKKKFGKLRNIVQQQKECGKLCHCHSFKHSVC